MTVPLMGFHGASILPEYRAHIYGRKTISHSREVLLFLVLRLMEQHSELQQTIDHLQTAKTSEEREEISTLKMGSLRLGPKVYGCIDVT